MPRFKVERVARGATVPEYALACTAMILAIAGAVTALEATAAQDVNNQAACIESRPPPPPVTNGAGDVISGCQLPAISTTTTIDPPPVPTTAVPPPSADSSFGTPSSVFDSPPFWQATAPFQVMSGSEPVPDAVVTVRVDDPSSPTPFFVTCATGATGSCDLVFNVPDAATTAVTFTVEDIDYPDGFGPGTTPGPVTINSPPVGP